MSPAPPSLRAGRLPFAGEPAIRLDLGRRGPRLASPCRMGARAGPGPPGGGDAARA